MNKVQFKIVARHYDKTGMILKGTYFDRRVKSVCSLLVDGTFITRPPLTSEQSQVWDIYVTSSEPVKDAQGRLTGSHRAFIEFSYWPLEFEQNLTDPLEHELNIRYRNLHDFIRYHADVSVKDAQGNETNPNVRGDIQFELVNVTENILETTKKNQRIFEAGQKLQELFNQEDKKAFIDFCYAYSIPQVDKFDVSTLMNLCSTKINDNPEWFFHVYNSKHRDIYTLIEMGLNKDISNGLGNKRTALVQNGESFYLDGNYIAGNREELIGVLEVDVTRRRILENMVSFSITAAKAVNAEVKELKVDVVKEKTKAEMHEGANTRERWLQSLRGQVLGAFKFKDESKITERVRQLHEEYDNRLGAEVVDSMVAHQRKLKEKRAETEHHVPTATAIKN
jgi:hypothetical protein